MSFLGVDLGTSGIRVAAYSVDGRDLATVEQRLTLRRPAPGRVELDAIEIQNAVEDSIRRLTARDEIQADPVRAISFSVQGEAILAVNSQGEPLTPVVVSMDERGTSAAAELARRMPGAKYHHLTGQPLHPMFSGFKIAAESGPWREAERYVTLGDFLTNRWTGEAVVDYGMAARTGLFDVEHLTWSASVLDELGAFAPWLETGKLSRPCPSGQLAGVLRPSDAARLGLSGEVVVALGTHDQAAAFLGSDGRPEGRSCISLGSSDCFTIGSVHRPDGFDQTGFASYPIDDSTWVTLAGTAAGGWALEWFSSIVGADSVGAVFNDLSSEPPALVAVPYLRGSGTLDNDPTSTGTVHGLTLETTRAQLARAFVEASGFEFAKIAAAFEQHGVHAGEVVVCGSGARNRQALGARANAFGRPLTPGPDNASCRGAALLAARSIGADADFESSLLHDSDPVQPEPTYTEWYQGQRDRYVALADATRLLTPFQAKTHTK